MTEAQEIINNIRQNPKYSGQIYKTILIHGENGKKIPIDEIFESDSLELKICKNTGINFLYHHQKEVFDRLKKVGGKCVLLTPIGSGRNFISELMSIFYYLNLNKNVLFISPYPERSKIQFNRFKSFLDKVDFNFLLEIDKLISKEDLTDFSIPGVLFTTPDFINEEILPKSLTRWKEFLKNIGLIIIEDLEEYYGIYGVNSSFLLRRILRVLRNFNNELSLLLHSLPLYDFENHIRYLTGEDFNFSDFVVVDTRERPSILLICWSIPFILERPLSEKPVRRALLKELEIILSIFSDINQELNIIFLKNDLFIKGLDVTRIEQGLGKPLGNFMHADKLKNIDLRKKGLEYEDIDLLISAGYPGSLIHLMHQIKHLGKDLLIAIIINDMDPLDQYFIRKIEEKIELSKEYPDISSGLRCFSLPIRRKHLLAAMTDFPLKDKDIIKIFGKSIWQEVFSENMNKIIEFHVPLEKNNRIYILRQSEEQRFLKPHLHTVGEVWMDEEHPGLLSVVERRGREDINLFYIDNKGIFGRLYPAKVFFFKDERYRVRNFDFNNNSIHVETEDELVMTEKIHQIKEITFIHNSDQEIFFSEKKEEFHLNITYGKLNLKETISGYREFEFFDVEYEGEPNYYKETTSDETKEYENELFTEGIKIELDNTAFEIIHSITHLLKICLSNFIICNKDEIEIITKDNAIYIYENIPSSVGYAHYIFNNFNDLWERFLLMAYDILISCACKEGCSGCLKVKNCYHSNYNTDLDKKETIKYIGEILKKHPTDLEKNIKKKYGPLGNDPKDVLILEEIARDVIQAEKNILGIEIPNPVSVCFMTEQEAQSSNVAGLWHRKENVIALIPGYDEYFYFDILSHEYFHDWQSKSQELFKKELLYYNKENIMDPNNLLFSGKIIVEGSANWAEFKIIDYYSMGRIKAGIAQKHFDQYGEGFKLIMWIEANFGIKGVFEFFKTLEIGDSINFVDPTQRREIYNQASVTAAVLGKEKEIRDNGGLKCLEYLGRLHNLVCISYFCDPTKPRAIQELGKDEISKKNIKFSSMKKVIEINKELVKKNFPACLNCKSNSQCSLYDACHLHSSEEKLTSKLLKEIINSI